MKLRTLVIVGVGLIGGSIGLAARKRGLAGRIVGVGRQQSSLDRAGRLGAIDEGFLDLAPAVADADLIVFCAPVQLIVEQVLQAAEHCPKSALLTDAGSTKSEIVRAIEGQLPKDRTFVGSHPLAGSEKKGPDYADAELFQNRLTIITRTEQISDSVLAQVSAFWQALGSRIKVMSPEDHDQALAFTSHLPHLLASALAGILPEDFFELTATGFRDTTRVAAGDLSIWTGIFQQNRQAVVATLDTLLARLGDFRNALTAGDATKIDALLLEGKKVRDALGS
jgi:cyclohexadieny/prephenate dehydrogenase